MFIGQRLGGQIPRAGTWFVDAQSSISVATNFVNQDVIRWRNVNPEVISVITNCDATATFNVWYGQSSISVTTNISSLVERFRNGEADITIDAEIDADLQRLRNQQSAIEVIADLGIGVQGVILGASAIDVSVAVDPDAIRRRLGASDISVETVAEGIASFVEALFNYDGSLAPGDVLIIDTDDLTVESDTGSNLRKYFDGEWYKVDPDKTDSMTWKDAEADRDIEFTIEKEDRSV